MVDDNTRVFRCKGSYKVEREIKSLLKIDPDIRSGYLPRGNFNCTLTASQYLILKNSDIKITEDKRFKDKNKPSLEDWVNEKIIDTHCPKCGSSRGYEAIIIEYRHCIVDKDGNWQESLDCYDSNITGPYTCKKCKENFDELPGIPRKK